MSLRSTMASVRSSLIAMLAEIFPIELYSPPDLLFTIFDVALPLPLSATDPAPPLSVPEHKEINEDSVATALGYVAQVLQLLAAYLGTNLLYPVTCIGSRSLVRDGISAMIGPRMYVCLALKIHIRSSHPSQVSIILERGRHLSIRICGFLVE